MATSPIPPNRLIALGRQLLFSDIHHAVAKKRLWNQEKDKLTKYDRMVSVRVPEETEYRLTDEDIATLLTENCLTVQRTQHETTYCHCGRGTRPDWEFCRCGPTIEHYYEISWQP